MARDKTQFTCNACGASSPKWLGKCPGCGEWNTLEETLAEAAGAIEAETGVPITSSNHAMAWHALRLAGVDDTMPQWGRLFEAQLA